MSCRHSLTCAALILIPSLACDNPNIAAFFSASQADGGTETSKEAFPQKYVILNLAANSVPLQEGLAPIEDFDEEKVLYSAFANFLEFAEPDCKGKTFVQVHRPAITAGPDSPPEIGTCRVQVLSEDQFTEEYDFNDIECEFALPLFLDPGAIVLTGPNGSALLENVAAGTSSGDTSEAYILLTNSGVEFRPGDDLNWFTTGSADLPSFTWESHLPTEFGIITPIETDSSFRLNGQQDLPFVWMPASNVTADRKEITISISQITEDPITARIVTCRFDESKGEAIVPADMLRAFRDSGLGSIVSVARTLITERDLNDTTRIVEVISEHTAFEPAFQP